MKNVKKLLSLLVALVLCLALGACALAEGKVLNYGTDTWPAGFDPHTISALAAARVFNQVY